MRKRALFSLYDASGADRFAAELIRAGWDVVASRETVAVLRRAGLPVTDVAAFVENTEHFPFPPTLHPRIEAALTSTDNTTARIDLVYVRPYPLSEGNDVGGRTLLSLAAKGGRIPVFSAQDMERTVTQIVATGDVEAEFRRYLTEKTWFEVARHYAGLAGDTDEHCSRLGEFSFGLMNGENPYQTPAAAFCCKDEGDDALSLLRFKQLSGDPMCFTNAADADRILHTMCLAAEAFRRNTASIPLVCVAAKHGNPCGFGVSRNTPLEALERALFGNPRSIWGGEVIVNFGLDAGLAGFLKKSAAREERLGNGAWMLDLIMAPHWSPEAIAVLSERKQRKLLENPILREAFMRTNGYDIRPVRGGFLRQPPANYVLDLSGCDCTGPARSSDWRESLVVAWATAFSSNHGGNEVALARSGALIGVGGGPSTVEAASVAVLRARECGHDPLTSVFAADAFLPFIDAAAVLCNAGVSGGAVPAGGKREREVRDYFAARDLSMVYIPEQFRGFCRH